MLAISVRAWSDVNWSGSRPSAGVTSEQRHQDRYDHLVASASGLALDVDQRRQAEDANALILIGHLHASSQELRVTPSIVQTTEDIEGSETSAQQHLTCSAQQGLAGPEIPSGGISDSSVQGAQGNEEALDVLGRLLGNDVDIHGGDGRAVKHGRRSADDDEVDPAGAQRGDEVSQISGLRV
jgi:hypothetical protein